MLLCLIPTLPLLEKQLKLCWLSIAKESSVKKLIIFLIDILDYLDRQYELIRVANAAIDIYSVVAVLSRATYALNKNQEAAAHDLQVAQLFTRNASKRIQRSLSEASKPNEKDLSQIESIARQVYEANGLAHRHPIDV